MGSVLDKNSSLVRKRIEQHEFDTEDGDEYEGSKFRGFGDYFRRKKMKLQNLDVEMRAASDDKPLIFKGIAAHVTGYTQPPLHVLHREIVQHGGGFLQYLDSKTMATHIIASTLPPKKSVEFSRYRIVKPAWIVDSVAAGRLLPWTEYCVLDQGPRQKVLKPADGKGLSPVIPEAKRGYYEQTENSFYTGQAKKRAAAAAAAAAAAEATAFPSQGVSQLAEKLHTPDAASGATDTRPSMGGLAPGSRAASSSLAAGSTDPEPPKGMTSEEHNAWLLSDPRLKKWSTANPEFLKQFYSESRLHHLSTWKASLKSSMQRLAAEKGLPAKRLKRKPGARQYIMHVDFDSFFCAVSLKKHPEYADKPTVVAHGAGPGSEIASCNYPAREFGVRNGMWMKRALELCPEIKVLPYDFAAYEDASRLFYEAVLSVGGVVQSVSIDEALIDATDVVLVASASQGVGIDEGSIWREQAKADELAGSLRESILAKTGCAVSVGIGGNILQAKVALRRAKPAGQFRLRPEDVLGVIGELRVEELPSVSYSIGGRLGELGVRLVKDVRELSRERLASALGPKTGQRLAEYSRGIDGAEVGEQPPRKSVSAEVNWGIRFINQQEAEEFVCNLCKELEKRLLNEQVKGRHLTVKIMRRSPDAPLDPAKHLGHGKCDTFNRSSALGVATASYEVLGKEAVSILRSFKFSPGDVRGLGVQMTKLEPVKPNTSVQGSQRTLQFAAFSGPPSARKQARVEPIDEIESPQESPQKAAAAERQRSIDHDPIADGDDDAATPRKPPRVHPAMALTRAGQGDAKATTPLNVSGTQFIMPSNPDPAVLAELPSDIRRRLMAQGPRASPSRAGSGAESAAESAQGGGLIPSQVDAEVFNALPEDMKAEILETYGKRQSPKREAPAQAKRPPTTPTKRGGIRGLFGRAQRRRDAQQAGVVQTTFLAARHGGGEAQMAAAEEAEEELDADFLAELPEDVRREVVDDHRRRQLARRSGLDAPARRQHGPDPGGPLGRGQQRRIQFPAPPPKIAFAGSGVTSTQEIKDMLDAWHTETRGSGPHGGDVDMLAEYLGRVVLEERDMGKAAALVKWLALLVEQDGEEGGPGQAEWLEAMGRVKEATQAAVKQRGLGPLSFA